MTSDSTNATLAFLTRRVKALEKQAEELEKALQAVEGNQTVYFRPVLDAIFEGIKQNGEDHYKIIKHLGIE